MHRAFATMKRGLVNAIRYLYRGLVRNEQLRFQITCFLIRHSGRFLFRIKAHLLMHPLQSDNATQGDDIIGAIDLPAVPVNGAAEQSGAIEVVGWAVSKSGIEKIEIYCDGKLVGEAHYGALRPDLVAMYSGFCDPARSGYYWLLDTTRLAKGEHDLAVVAYSRNGAVADLHRKIMVGDANAVYQRWIEANELTEAARKTLCAEIEADGGRGLISIVALADASVDHEMLARTADSLQGQLYGNWELLICADNVSAPKLKALLDTFAEPRIALTTFEKPTWQELFAACRGRYIGVINVGDDLDTRALWAVVKNVAATPDAGLVYADEDRLVSGQRISPRFKPAWSPIYLQDYNYIGRPWFGSAQLLQSVAIEGEPCNAATEHALLKRLGAVAEKVIHVPMVLCSRGEVVAESSAVKKEEPHSESASRQASGSDTMPRVSVVIPTCLRNLDIIEKCFSSLLKRTEYPDLEVIVVKNNVANEEEGRQFLERWPFKVITWDGSFNWSGINNFGARQATGDLLLFMNDDVEALNHDWLINMVSLANLKPVGAVGAMLMYPNRTIQHGGIIFVNSGGGSRHLLRSCNGSELQIEAMFSHNRESSAVTGACLLTRRDVFDSINGFDETLPLVNNDTDYCLRVGEEGLACVVAAGATLIHHEGISRAGISETDDVKLFRARWNSLLMSCDPYSHPNLDDTRDDWWLNPHSVATINGRIGRGASSTASAISL